MSQYVHNIDALTMDEDERKFVDAKIDSLYDDIAKGIYQSTLWHRMVGGSIANFENSTIQFHVLKPP